VEKNFEFIDSETEGDVVDSVGVWVSDAEFQLNKRLSDILKQASTTITSQNEDTVCSGQLSLLPSQ